MARADERWGHRRITGELVGLGITVAPSTVWEIPKKHGIGPATRRSGPMRAVFLRSQAKAVIACDLFTVDLLNGTKAYVLAVAEHVIRRIHILGAATHPTHEWATQQVRSLFMDLDESAGRIRFLTRERDIPYPPEFGHLLSDNGITTVCSGVRTPRMNAIMERRIGGRCRELLGRTLVWNLPQLRWPLRDYETHDNTHQPHTALASATLDQPLPPEVVELDAFRARKRVRVGGVIREYYRAA